MNDLIKLYNPANAASLTSDELAGLQKLTSSEIKELAIAYPNITMQRAYLLIIDSTKPVEKQLPSLSTFENLWNLREKNALRKFVAYAFKGTYKAKTNAPLRPKRTEVLDLSDTELLSLPGFKKDGTGWDGKINPKKTTEFELQQNGTIKEVEPLQVKVTKIKKVPANPLEKSMEEIDSLEIVKSEFQKKLIKVPAKKTKSK